jgi:hypothetical protein
MPEKIQGAQHEKHVLNSELTTYCSHVLTQYGREPYRKMVGEIKLA